MDFVEGVLSFLGGVLRVIGGLFDALDLVDLFGWWVLYVIPAPLWAAAAYMAFGGEAAGPRSFFAAALAFAAGVAMTFVWARKGGETAGYVLWGATAACFVLILARLAFAPA